MAYKTYASVDILSEVPQAKRDRIVAGMRWTVWLSAVSLPFSYGTTILLARTSPEAMGTYGLLGLYISVTLGLFYLGGDAVAIKYIPEVDATKRLAFLSSYFLVICLATLPWLAAAAVWSNKLHYLLGDQASPRFELLILFLSPITILSSLIGAALKGMLEIRWAQAMARLTTIGSFVVYGISYVLFRAQLAHSYTVIIWVTYLALSLLGIAFGLWRLLHAFEKRHALHFYLPPRFWRYTLSLQQLSAIGFFTQRLDVILVLNFANLAVLGKYVALITLGESIRLISRFFVDTLFPSLTNMLAAQDLRAASDVFSAHMRILFLVSAASTCGVALLARPITSLLGRGYAGLAPLIVVLVFLIGLANPAGVGGILLSSVGKQQRAVWVAVVQALLYVSLFIFLWHRWQLLGAVTAYGISLAFGSFGTLLAAKRSLPFRIHVARDYVAYAIIIAAAAVMARVVDLSILSGTVAWLLLMVTLLVMSRYSFAECARLFKLFVPLPIGARSLHDRRGA